MNVFWKILEYIPKNKKWHDHPEIQKKRGYYLPLQERRYIPPDAQIHSSVTERIKATENSGAAKYLPVNLPPGKPQ
ncbi:hypothetical protein AB833_24845 [Chromatiales bacterium (ex Bugula neritina AB1)]|nr:hypothetical protein AB833_24845 [Chromatiales bacterium (ex Bugula neritina AB1)]